MSTVDMFTDGACANNPGNGGWACILFYPSYKNYIAWKEISGGEKNTTNNRMELMAVIKGLEALKEPCEVKVYTDSKYVSNAFNLNWISNWVLKNWGGVKNPDLWQRLLELTQKHKVEFIWVKGHSDNKWNNRCDELAVKESRSV